MDARSGKTVFSTCLQGIFLIEGIEEVEKNRNTIAKRQQTIYR